jgi:hypothetical protein
MVMCIPRCSLRGRRRSADATDRPRLGAATTVGQAVWNHSTIKVMKAVCILCSRDSSYTELCIPRCCLRGRGAPPTRRTAPVSGAATTFGQGSVELFEDKGRKAAFAFCVHGIHPIRSCAFHVAAFGDEGAPPNRDTPVSGAATTFGQALWNYSRIKVRKAAFAFCVHGILPTRSCAFHIAAFETEALRRRDAASTAMIGLGRSGCKSG